MEKIIEEWVLRSISRNVDDLPEVGENISIIPEIKIAFDGYQEDDDGIEDLNEQSFAVYIHKCSGDENFIFPEHEKTAWSVVQRPAEEICHFVWVSFESNECSGPALEDCISESDLESAQVERIINILASRYPE